MEKWTLDKYRLKKIIDSNLLCVYFDPYYDPKYFSELLVLFPVPSLDFADYDPDKLFFKRTEIEHFEKKHRRFLPSSASLYSDNDKEIPKQEISTADIQDKTINQNDIPTIAFYKDSDFWKIGEKGKEATLKHLNGFDYIAFLIRHRNESFNPVEVYHLGNVPEDLKYLNRIDYQKIGDTSDLKNHIKLLEEKLRVEVDPNERIDITDKIEKLRKIKNEGLRSFKQKSESCRKSVYRSIKTATKKIQKELPSLKKYFICGRYEIIKTGKDFSWFQIC